MSPGPLAERVALVTGSSRGIGAAIARRFAADGARVLVTYRKERGRAVALARELDAGDPVALDVGERGSVRAAVAEALRRWDRLDVLVNNAGYLRQVPLDEIDDEEWDLALNVNLRGVFRCTQEAARRMTEGGVIVNVASVGGQIGGVKAPHYAASKAAVLAFTKSCANHLAPRGIRVNAVSPGFIRTDMYDAIRSEHGEDELLAAVPLRRIGEPEEVAAAAAYLASDESAFVTGQVLNVNGGQYMG